MIRMFLVLAAACFVPWMLGSTSASAAFDQEEGWIKLFNGRDLSGWKIFLDPASKVSPKAIWKVDDGMIVCDGSVYGYLLTEKEYGNYVLKVQWRWGEKVSRWRNSGVFVHVSGPDKIWPKGVEAQLEAGHAGDFWLVDHFKLTIDPQRRDPKIARHYYRLKDHVEVREAANVAQCKNQLKQMGLAFQQPPRHLQRFSFRRTGLDS